MKYFFLFLFITSCGFQVIYQDENLQNQAQYERELASVRIQKDSGRLTQELRNAIKDTFNPDFIDVEPKYVLSLNLTHGIAGTFITSTGASGRNKIMMTVEYILRDANTGKILATNSTSVNDNYDVQTNRYGTYVAEDYVRSNLMKIAALNIRNLLVNDFIELKKNPDIDEVLVNGVFKDEKTREKEAKIAAETSCVSDEFDENVLMLTIPALPTTKY